MRPFDLPAALRFGLLICLVGCTSPDPGSESDAARTSDDQAGLYRGVVPCADCEGIDVLLELREDGTFERVSRYVGASDEAHVSSGRFGFAEGETRPPAGELQRLVVLDAGAPSEVAYRVETDGLRQLDRDRREITGDLADRYLLRRIGDGTRDPRRLEGDWWVSELAGVAVEPDPTRRRRPRLHFDFARGRLSFTGGCNQFAGAADFTGPGRVAMVGPFAGTRMMCPGRADFDSELTEALRSSTLWRIEDAAGSSEAVLELFSEVDGIPKVRLQRPDPDFDPSRSEAQAGGSEDP